MNKLSRYSTVVGSVCLALVCTASAHAQWKQKMVGITSLQFSPDGRWLAAGNVEDFLGPGDLRLYDATTGKLRHKERYVYGVRSVDFSPDGKSLAVVTMVEKAQNPIRVWNLRTWRVERMLGGNLYLDSTDYSPDGTRLVASSGFGHNGETWANYLWSIKRNQYKPLPQSVGLTDLKFAPRGNFILGAYVYGNPDGQDLRAWNGRGRFLWKRAAPGITDIAILPDGSHALSGSSPTDEPKSPAKSALQLWDLAKGRIIYTIKQPYGVSTVAVSRDGRRWATGDAHGNIRLWDGRTRKVLKKWALHRDGVGHLTFSPDGKWLASAGADDTIRVTRVR